MKILSSLVFVAQALATEPAIEKPQQLLSEKQLDCLIKNAYHEANGEGRTGRLLVTQVVFNRTTDENFCKTIYDRKQFSWTSKKAKQIPTIDYNKISLEIQELFYGFTEIPKGLKKATYFHTTAVKPYWAKAFTKVGVWKNHVFYAA